MIDIKFVREHNKLVSFDISGHAGYADSGYDIICSAVSAISYTIANGITEVLSIEAPYEIHDGFLNMDIGVCSSVDIEKSQVLLETMLLGFQSMRVNYGDYINLSVEEVQ